MKRFIAIVIVLAICAVGFGFYRGWFVLSSPSPSEGSNQININLATDKDRMSTDVETVRDKAAELTGSGNERIGEPADQPTNEEAQSPDASRKEEESDVEETATTNDTNRPE